MTKQTKNLTVSKIKRKKQEDKTLDVEFLKQDFRNKLDGAFQALYSVFKAIPVSPMEIEHIYFEIQMIQGWSNLFIESLTEKQPPDNTSP